MKRKNWLACMKNAVMIFPNPEAANEEVFRANVEESKQHLEQSEPKEVSQRMIELMDDVSDLLTLVKRPVPGIQFHQRIEDNDTNQTLYGDYQQLEQLITEHLISDKNGATKGKVGFFGEDGDERAEKLIGLMALQHLRTLAAQDAELVLLKLADVSEKDSDCHRVLKRLATVFDYDSLELESVSSKLVN